MIRIGLFLAGFGLWAIGSFLAGGARGIREAWDGSFYWMFGVPLLLLVQATATPWLGDRPKLQPAWVLAGHVAAMLMIHPAGTDLGLLPLAMVFLGLPAYGALYLAGLAGRAVLPARQA